MNTNYSHLSVNITIIRLFKHVQCWRMGVFYNSFGYWIDLAHSLGPFVIIFCHFIDCGRSIRKIADALINNENNLTATYPSPHWLDQIPLLIKKQYEHPQIVSDACVISHQWSEYHQCADVSLVNQLLTETTAPPSLCLQALISL